MIKRLLGMIGGAVLALGCMEGAAMATVVGVPCETCGVALGAPLPEGVFFTDNESYGQRDGQGNRLGANVPITIWSTPFSFYDTRFEIFAAIPVFTHIDGNTINRVDNFSPAILFAFAHDFGNGFNLFLSAGPRGQDNFVQAGRGAIADLRTAISYVKNGYDFTVSANYGGVFGGKVLATSATGVQSGDGDSLFIDYTATKKFGKFEFGVVGTFYNDITGPGPRGQSLSVGGLAGYDFGAATVQVYVTREVEIRNGGWGIGPGTPPGGEETRGYFRLILPLYVAPAAPKPVVARY